MVDVPRADKSGAEVTAVQTLREFRRRLNFAKRPGVRQPFRLRGALLRHGERHSNRKRRFGCFHKARNSKPFLPRRNQRLMQSQNNAGHHIMAQIGLAPETG